MKNQIQVNVMVLGALGKYIFYCFFWLVLVVKARVEGEVGIYENQWPGKIKQKERVHACSIFLRQDAIKYQVFAQCRLVQENQEREGRKDERDKLKIPNGRSATSITDPLWTEPLNFGGSLAWHILHSLPPHLLLSCRRSACSLCLHWLCVSVCVSAVLGGRQKLKKCVCPTPSPRCTANLGFFHQIRKPSHSLTHYKQDHSHARVAFCSCL